jgi:hypothetical protein
VAPVLRQQIAGGHFAQALQLAGALLNELLAVASQLPDRGDLRWRDEAAP